jgi:hypothetical protein
MLFMTNYQKSQVKQTVLISLLILVIAAATAFALNSTFPGQHPTGSLVSEDASLSAGGSDPQTSEPDAAAEPGTGNGASGDDSVPDTGEQAGISSGGTDISEPPEDSVSPPPEETANETDTAGAPGPDGAANISIPPEDVSGHDNETEIPPELTEPPAGNETANITYPEQPEENITQPEAPETNTTEPEEINETANITIPELPETNTTEPANETLNVTQPEQPQTPEINATEPPVIPEPAIQLTITQPQKITRGESFVLEAVATSTGSASALNVVLEWLLPEHFVTSDSISFNCGTLEAGASCTTSITVNVPVSAPLGENEVKVKATYG